MGTLLFALQRLTALILAPLVLVHLGLILWATRDGLSAAEILGRTQGSLGWALFYVLFVGAAALHAHIGLRRVLREWFPRHPLRIDLATIALGLVLLVLGLRGVWAVFAPGGGA